MARPPSLDLAGQRILHGSNGLRWLSLSRSVPAPAEQISPDPSASLSLSLQDNVADEPAISSLPEAQLHPFLLIECPRMLFPFIRRIVSDVTRDGGFPSLNLENIDFLQLYKTEIGRKSGNQQINQDGRDRSVTPLN